MFGWRALAAWAVLLVLTATMVVRTQLADMLRATPELALQIDPGNAEALVRLATIRQSGAGGQGIDMRGAQDAALAALRRDPLLPEAWRILGTSFLDDPGQVTERLEFAERLSRRDMPTQLALIEHTASQGDVAATLHRYDIVMRVSPAYDQVLFPVLASALDNPIVLRAVSRQLPDAPWRRRFFSYLVEGGATYPRQAELFAAIAAQGSLPDRDIVALQAGRAAADRQYDAALALYRLADPEGAAKLVRNPDFALTGGTEPFDWQLETAGLVNVGVTGLGEQARLEMTSVRGDGGQTARQLLYLPAGRYHLSARIGPVEGYGAVPVSLAISCTGGGEIAGFENDPERTGRVGGTFTVPRGCPVQWLAIAMRQDLGGGRSGAWIGDLSLEPAGG